jgi:hypothetical protein
VDTGWLIVGAAGVSGGLALVLVGAGMATSSLLLPAGLVLAFVAYLAWIAGSSRVVATVYEEVGDPGRSTAADGRTGRRQDRMDPDGNWGTAADGGQEPGAGAASDDGPGTGARAGTHAGAERTTGLGPDGRKVWDARERDRVGGWDDWEWTDRRWRKFEREYAESRRGRNHTRRDRHDPSGPGGASHDQRRREDARSRTRQRARERADTDGSGRERSQGSHRSRRGGRGGRTRRRPGDDRMARARELLGVDPGADEETVRQAYRERVKETHPDRGGDSEAFKRVQWAYEYLSESA